MSLFATICLIAFGFTSNNPKRKRTDSVPAALESLLVSWPKKLFREGDAVQFRKNKITRYGKVSRYDDFLKKFVIIAYDGLLPTTIERNPLHIKNISKETAAKKFLKSGDEVKFAHGQKVRYGTILRASESGYAYKIRSYDDDLINDYRRCIRNIIKLTPEEIEQRRNEHRERKNKEDYENCSICSMTYTDDNPIAENPVNRSSFDGCKHHVCITCRESLSSAIWTYVVKCPFCKSAQFRNPWDTHHFRDQKHLQQAMDREERMDFADLTDAILRVGAAMQNGNDEADISEDQEEDYGENTIYIYDPLRTDLETEDNEAYEPPVFTYEGLQNQYEDEQVDSQLEQENANHVDEQEDANYVDEQEEIYNIDLNEFPNVEFDESEEQVQRILEELFFPQQENNN